MAPVRCGGSWAIIPWGHPQNKPQWSFAAMQLFSWIALPTLVLVMQNLHSYGCSAAVAPETQQTDLVSEFRLSLFSAFVNSLCMLKCVRTQLGTCCALLPSEGRELHD